MYCFQSGQQLFNCVVFSFVGWNKISWTRLLICCRNFDASLKSRDPSWGVRNLEDVIAAAESIGLEHKETVEMPANNLSVIFQKKKAA